MPTVDMRGYGPERRAGIKLGKGAPMVQATPSGPELIPSNNRVRFLQFLTTEQGW